jgi:hypothetical protein
VKVNKFKKEVEKLEAVLVEIDESTENEFPTRRYLTTITRLIHAYQKMYGIKASNTPLTFWNSVKKIAKKNRADSKRLEQLAHWYSNTVNVGPRD